MEKNLIIIFLTFFITSAFAAEKPAKKVDFRLGCWVEYKITQPTQPQQITCKITVTSLSLEALELQVEIEGVDTKKIEVERKNFSPERLLAPDNIKPTSYAEKKEIDFLPQKMSESVRTTFYEWEYENGATKVWRSEEIPFGLAKSDCGGVVLEVLAFSWGTEKEINNKK